MPVSLEFDGAAQRAASSSKPGPYEIVFNTLARPRQTSRRTRTLGPIIEAARATREVAWGRWLDNVDPPSSSAAVPSLVPGGEAEGGQRQPSLAGRFSDGPRPALSTEIMDSSGDISRPGT